MGIKMFSIFSSKSVDRKEVIKKLEVDLHSHLIPGIDDGASNINESLELIKELKKIGYKKLIMTPHIMVDAYPNQEDDIRNRLDSLRKNAKEAQIDIALDAAAEYYLDEGFISHLNNNPLLINREYLLFETSYMAKPINMHDLICDITAKGYKPLLAHPERYRYIKDFENEYNKLKDLGVYFQLDINSLGGFYGRDAEKKALYLLDNGLIDFVGSDTHNLRHINHLNKTLDKKNIWYNLFEKNQIMNNKLI